jgi:hypothetical protein
VSTLANLVTQVKNVEVPERVKRFLAVERSANREASAGDLIPGTEAGAEVLPNKLDQIPVAIVREIVVIRFTRTVHARGDGGPLPEYT